MDFFSSWFAFDRSHRLLLGFESPIHAGIFIAAIIPWIRFTAWPANTSNRPGKFFIVASCAVELALLYFLSRTGSRGPMLALLVAYAVEIALCFRAKDRGLAKLLLLRSGLAMVALVLFVTLSGFGGRFAEAVTLTDDSIQNRLEILKNARPLLLLNPVSGVGWGWSAHHYSQWFEPQHLRYLYNSLSNEYLQIGAELGMPLFFVILACICTALAAPWFQGAPQAGVRALLTRKAYCSFVMFAAVTWTTSYRYSMTLVVMTFLVFAISAISAGVSKTCLKWRALAAGIAGALCVIAAFLLMPAPSATVRAAMRNDNIVALQNTSAPPASAGKILVFVDKDILGQVYGQTLRLMLEHAPFDGKMLVALPFAKMPARYPGAAAGNIGACIVFGSAIASPAMANLPPLRQLIIAHPSVRPPEKLPDAASIRVILPAIDEAGVNESWRRFCRDKNIPVSITPASGLDVQHCAETFFTAHD